MSPFVPGALPAEAIGGLILQAAEASGFGVVVLDRERVRYANPAVETMLGTECLTGRALSEEGRSDALALLGRLLDPATPRLFEFNVNSAQGRRRVLEASASQLQTESGEVTVALLRDVSERGELREQVSRAEKLASLGTLAAGVAHEVNNPLTFMTLGIGLVSTRLESSSIPVEERTPLLSTLTEIRKGAERVADIVRELNSFARVDGERRDLCDLAVIVGRAQRIVAHRARHVAQISLEVGELPPLLTDPGRLEQVLVNLLVNAAQALEQMPAGKAGQIQVRASLVPDQRVLVEVLDNGPGIPAAILDRIFDPFFTTKPVGEGTGLGLSVCHGIVAQLGGRLTVESEPGRTRFALDLPLRSVASTLPPPMSGERARSENKLRVLVIDDDPTVLQAIRRSAQREHDVVAVSQGSEALDLLAADRRFDVILCDLAMPILSGAEVYAAIERDMPELLPRFAIMTGGAPTTRLREFLEAFQGPKLLKPFSLRELSGIFVQVVARAS